MIIAKNAGKPSVKSLKSILVIDVTINNPTTTNIGAVANEGMAVKIGAKMRATKNSTPVVSAVSPVLPPSATPDALSTKLVTVEVPKQAPETVPTASANNASFAFGSLPSLSRRFPLLATPIRVPTVSKISTNKNENIITKKSNPSLNAPAKSNLKM